MQNDTKQVQRYVRKKDGVFLKYSVGLPFSDERHSFSVNTDFKTLKEAGYFKLIPSRPVNLEFQTVTGVNIKQVDDDSVKLEFIYKPLPKDEQMKALSREFIRRVELELDSKARQKGYDNIVSVCSYAGYENEFKAEGEAFGKWRAKVWKWGYELMDYYKTHQIDKSLDEILKQMPKMEGNDEL